VTGVQTCALPIFRHLESIDKQRAGIDAQLVHSARLVSLGRMAAGVAHEINNPLAAIGEMAGLMDDLMDEEFVQAHPRGPKFKANLAKIQHHVERARGVTHRLLGFARRMEPQQDTVDVNDIVSETCPFLEKEALFRKVDLTRDLGAKLPRIKSDRAQLQQVFLNLLNNALDAVGEGGHITLTSRLNGDFVEVSVADDGPGIPPICGNGSSIHSSPPRDLVRAPAWDCPSATPSCSGWAAPWPLKANPATGPPSWCAFPRCWRSRRQA
jgi:two-component system NtrC family sensor kinase